MTASAHADIVVTAEAPRVQASGVTGVSTMDFNSVATGVYTTLASPIGTYTSTGLAIVAPDAYGGANATRYFSVGVQSGQQQATLNLSTTAAYFGFFWGAGDNQNSVQFYLGSVLLGNFNVGSIIPLLQAGHYGNPNNGAAGGEPFVYLNFIGTSGTVFDRVQFRNSDTGSGFETDNHSFRAAPLQTPFPGSPVATIPTVAEPSAAYLGVIGCIFLVVRLLSKKLRESERCSE